MAAFSSFFRIPLIKRFLQSSVCLALLMPLVRAVGFFLVLSLALRRLSADEIGFWYFLLNLSMACTTVELGFSASISRFASYLQAGSGDIGALGLTPLRQHGEPDVDRLRGLLLSARKLYIVFAILAGAVYLGAGTIWIALSDAINLQSGRHMLAFVIVGVGTAINMSGLYWQSVLTGINEMRRFYVFLLTGMLASYACWTAGLLSGIGLPAMALGLVAMTMIPIIESRRFLRKRFGDMGSNTDMPVRLLWPSTWRIGVVSLCDYLTVPGATLVLAMVGTVEEVASYGLSMQIALVIRQFSISWHFVKLPLLAQWQAQGRYDDIRSVCRQRMGLSLITYLATAGVLFFSFPLVLELIGSRTPPLSSIPHAALLASVGLNLLTGMHASSIQASNRVPHLPAYAMSAIASLVMAWLLGQRFGASGVAIATFLGQAAFAGWQTPLLFWRSMSSRSGGIT